MGCGQSSHFSDAGPGQLLGSATSSTTSHPPPTSKSNSNSATARSGIIGSGRAVGGGQSKGEAERREAMAKAAEERNKSASKRGAPSAGKLSAALAAQSADGGRAQEALRDGQNRDVPLVYD